MFTGYNDSGATIYTGWDLIYSCQAIAVLNNATYFGLQAGYQCTYGPSTTNLSLYGLVSDTQCASPCTNGTVDINYNGPNCNLYFLQIDDSKVVG